MRPSCVTPVEFVEHALDRIDRLDEQLGASSPVTPMPAREQAKAAEQAVQTRPTRRRWPPLRRPIADQGPHLTKGIVTKLGSTVYEEFVRTFDDYIVESLRAAGTISIGKTATPEFVCPVTPRPTSARRRARRGIPRVVGRLERSGRGGGRGSSVRAGQRRRRLRSHPASICGLVGQPSRDGSPRVRSTWTPPGCRLRTTDAHRPDALPPGRRGGTAAGRPGSLPRARRAVPAACDRTPARCGSAGSSTHRSSRDRPPGARMRGSRRAGCWRGSP